jgi:hypothetical protein
VRKIGTLDKLDVLCLNCSQPIMTIDQSLAPIQEEEESKSSFNSNETVLSVPPCLLLASLFEAYKFVFEDKTEHCILYYLFHNDLVNTAYSSKALLKVVIPLLVQ